MYKGTSIRLSENFSAETFQARREWDDIFKNQKEKQEKERKGKGKEKRKGKGKRREKKKKEKKERARETANQEYYTQQSCISKPNG